MNLTRHTKANFIISIFDINTPANQDDQIKIRLPNRLSFWSCTSALLANRAVSIMQQDANVLFGDNSESLAELQQHDVTTTAAT